MKPSRIINHHNFRERYAEEVNEMKEKRAVEKEWAKNFDVRFLHNISHIQLKKALKIFQYFCKLQESRDNRVKSWGDFHKKDKKKKKLATYKPPKTMLEVRTNPINNLGNRVDRDRRDMF